MEIYFILYEFFWTIDLEFFSKTPIRIKYDIQ